MVWRKMTQCPKERLLVSLFGIIFLFVVLVNLDVMDKPKRMIMRFKESIPESPLSLIPSKLGLGFSPQIPDTTSQLYERGEHLTKVCRKLSKQNRISQSLELNQRLYGSMYQNSDYKLLYCSIFKIGSSFWKRLFKVLDSSNKENRHILDMSSRSAHVNIPESMRLSHKNTKEILRSYTKFMFTRDPFARLFSGYVDKMTVPTDMLGKMIGQVKAWRGMKAEENCDYYVQFPEFCAFVADTILDKAPLDPHFTPIHEHCDPCFLNFTLIGKMETFMDDTRGILQVAGIELSRVMGDVEDVDAANEVRIIKDMIVSTYARLTRSAVGCATQLQILQRLWRLFQIRGLVSKNNSFPERFKTANQGRIDKYDYEKAAMYAYEHSSERRIRLLQREESLMQAYGTVPPDILKKLALAFATDCAIFDYSCNVDERFLKNYQKSNFSYLE